MEAKATLRYNRQSARKVRKTLDKVRGFKVGVAIDFLHFLQKKHLSLLKKPLDQLSQT